MDKRSGRLHPLPWTMSHYAYHRIAVTFSQLPRPSKVSQAQSCKDEAVMIVSLVRSQGDSLARITKSISRRTSPIQAAVSAPGSGSGRKHCMPRDWRARPPAAKQVKPLAGPPVDASLSRLMLVIMAKRSSLRSACWLCARSVTSRNSLTVSKMTFSAVT